jgi:hypothetical protein
MSGGGGGANSGGVDEECLLTIVTNDSEIRRRVERLPPAVVSEFVEGLEAAHLEKESLAAAVAANALGVSAASVTIPPKLFTCVRACLARGGQARR